MEHSGRWDFRSPPGAFYLFVPMKRGDHSRVWRKGHYRAGKCVRMQCTRLRPHRKHAASMEKLKTAVERIRAAVGE